MLIRGSLLLALSLPVWQASGQESPGPSASVGYNTFNEVYIGYEFPRKKDLKWIAQAGYQFALSQDATYMSFMGTMRSPFITNNAHGLRTRLGIKRNEAGRLHHFMFFLEYERLESNPFINDDYSGSSLAPYDIFTEQYSRYGFRFQRAVPLGEMVYFTYSVALFYSDVTRSYQMKGAPPTPSNLVETYGYWAPQLTAGLKFYIF